MSQATGQPSRIRPPGAHRVVPSESPGSPKPGKFSVGDRVIIGGGKRGVIRFIGTTKFAGGEWAGIELNEPVGKNDGSVAGVRYFTCPSQHGLFSKKEKLEHDKEARSAPAAKPKTLTTTDGGAGTQATPPSRKVSGTLYPKVGDRVLVAKTKKGTLRFVGLTEFASGQWAGVELDEPIGKNDGSVQGKRCVHDRGG